MAVVNATREEKVLRQKLSPWVALGLAGLVVALDGFVLAQGGIAFLVAAWMVFIAVPPALLLKRYRGHRVRRLGVIGIYLAASALTFAIIIANSQLANARAESLVAAVKAYHQAKGKWPEKLQDLVPAQIPAVPLARYTVWLNDFTYYRQGNDATLSYTTLPPFGRRLYSFQRGRWSSLD